MCSPRCASPPSSRSHGSAPTRSPPVGCSSLPRSGAPARSASKPRSARSPPASAPTWSSSTCASRTSTRRWATRYRSWCTRRARVTCAMCSWMESRWCSATSSSPRRSKKSCGRPTAPRPSFTAGSALEVRPHGPFGVRFDELHHGVVDLVEQLVQGDELRALHVPVRLLHLRLEIDRFREPVVEQIAHLAPHVLWKIVHGLVRHDTTPLIGGLIVCLSH